MPKATEDTALDGCADQKGQHSIKQARLAVYEQQRTTARITLMAADEDGYRHLVAQCGTSASVGLWMMLTEREIPAEDWPAYLAWAPSAWLGLREEPGSWAQETFGDLVREACAELPYGLDWAEVQPWTDIALAVANNGGIDIEYLETGVAIFDTRDLPGTQGTSAGGER